MFAIPLLNANETEPQVRVTGLAPNELSRTTRDEVAFWVQTSGRWAIPIVQFRRAAPLSEPKNNAPESIVNGETIDEISEGVISPKTATSMGRSVFIA